MKNKINNFYQIIKDSLFKYLVYLIIICLLAHLNEDIRNFGICLKDNNPYFLAACLIMLLLLIIVPYTRTKYKKYIEKISKENIIYSIYIFWAFIFFEKEYLFVTISFVMVIFVFPFIRCCFSQKKENEKLDNIQTLIYLDEPIKTKEQDSLGRDNFIKAIRNILLKNQISNKKNGFVLILSASWGEGKTSCLNLLREAVSESSEAKGTNSFEFIDINPWFNDTKEKLLNALFGELNHFAKLNFPHISLENQFDEIVKLSSVKLGNIELELDKFTEDKNIQNKIKEVGEQLNKYSRRIIITIDDIDRVEKNHILYILHVVQMFKEYTNIIFILSYDPVKLEEILCESSDSCYTDKAIYKSSCYRNYIEKIASVTTPLPKIEKIHMENMLFKEINNILVEEEMPTIKRIDFDFYISTSRFKTIRDIKRFCNTFLISYAEVKNEVNVFNYINITILFVFYSEIYNEAWIDQNQWFKSKINVHDNKQVSSIRQYFQNIIDKYKDEDIKNIYELIEVISPVYQQIPAEENKNYLKQSNKGDKSYFLDERYLQYYFTHDFSKSRIPDKVLDENLQDFLNEKNDEIREQNILSFMKKYNSKLVDLFNYLNIYYKEEYLNLIQQIILIFAKNSFDLLKDFSDIIEYISKIISIFTKYQATSVNDFLIEIIKDSSSVSFSIELYEKLNYNYDGLLNNTNINNILDDKISSNIKKSLESFKYEQCTRFLYFWLQKYYVTKKVDIVDIVDSRPEDYILTRNKVKSILPFIKDEVEYFMAFIGKDLEHAIKSYRDNNFIGLNNISFSNFIFFIDIWGKNNILDMLTNFLDNDNGKNYYDRINNLIVLYKMVLKDKKIANKVKEHEIKMFHKIGFYDLIRNIDIYEFDTEKFFNNFKFDYSYKYKDKRFFVEIRVANRNIESSRIKDLLVKLSNNEIIYFYYIVESKDEKEKLEREINEFISNINTSDKNKFGYRVEIKKDLLEKY